MAQLRHGAAFLFFEVSCRCCGSDHLSAELCPEQPAALALALATAPSAAPGKRGRAHCARQRPSRQVGCPRACATELAATWLAC